jgi:hypothetical protein
MNLFSLWAFLFSAVLRKGRGEANAQHSIVFVVFLHKIDIIRRVCMWSL